MQQVEVGMRGQWRTEGLRIHLTNGLVIRVSNPRHLPLPCAHVRRRNINTWPYVAALWNILLYLHMSKHVFLAVNILGLKWSKNVMRKSTLLSYKWKIPSFNKLKKKNTESRMIWKNKMGEPLNMWVQGAQARHIQGPSPVTENISTQWININFAWLDFKPNCTYDINTKMLVSNKGRIKDQAWAWGTVWGIL